MRGGPGMAAQAPAVCFGGFTPTQCSPAGVHGGGVLQISPPADIWQVKTAHSHGSEPLAPASLFAGKQIESLRYDRRGNLLATYNGGVSYWNFAARAGEEKQELPLPAPGAMLCGDVTPGATRSRLGPRCASSGCPASFQLRRARCPLHYAPLCVCHASQVATTSSPAATTPRCTSTTSGRTSGRGCSSRQAWRCALPCALVHCQGWVQEISCSLPRMPPRRWAETPLVLHCCALPFHARRR